MKRILVLITAALVMAAMIVAMSMPAIAMGNPTGKSNPYALVYAEPHGNTYVLTYKGPESPPGSEAAGGNPGYTEPGTCHGPHC